MLFAQWQKRRHNSWCMHSTMHHRYRQTDGYIYIVVYRCVVWQQLQFHIFTCSVIVTHCTQCNCKFRFNRLIDMGIRDVRFYSKSIHWHDFICIMCDVHVSIHVADFNQKQFQSLNIYLKKTTKSKLLQIIVSNDALMHFPFESHTKY